MSGRWERYAIDNNVREVREAKLATLQRNKLHTSNRSFFTSRYRGIDALKH